MENRIKEIRTEKGMTLQQVADKAGTTKAQVMKLEKGDRRLTDVWMVRLSIAMSCDPKELLGTNRTARQSLDAYNSGVSESSGGFDEDVSASKPARTPSPAPARPLAPASGCEAVAEIAVRGGMGGGGEAGVSYSDDGQGGVAIADDVKGNWFLPTDYLRSELNVSPVAARIIEVQGDSMTPTLVSGDRVMIDTNDQRPTPPGIFALWDGFGVVVKRLELIPNSDPPLLRISSDNANHNEYQRTIEEVNIIGRVVWYGRRM
ncbi:LexA family transcriptional regulator [Kiloniella sp. EL199]|uniref:XRE family transcriptional regulator n=1 Tax=Kiloniella sp. EL199 TaxID=2107581 RepID=UPI000EA138FC|nr:LexA family transcriptional regulator [Kiloniella sp. EL199]